MNIIFRLIVSLLDLFIPKDRTKISIPCILDDEWQGNCDFLYHYIKNHKTEFDVKVLCSAESRLFTSKSSKSLLRLYSLKGIFFLLRSKTIIYHHGPLAGRIPILPLRHFNIHINHGIHYKKVELSLSKDSQEYKKSSRVRTKWFCKYHCVSSHVDALSCCAYYHTYLSNIFITGIPRNDAFFISQEKLPEDVYSDIRRIEKMASDKKIIVYAPTWRNDGGAYHFSEQEIAILSTFLNENNAILFYAGHPYLKERSVPVDQNIVDFNNSYNDIQSILVLADCLITDYSSVWIDFLLKRKPIISFQFDKKRYKDDRGFLFDESNIFPGSIVESFNDLLEQLNIALVESENSHANFSHAYKLFHYHADGNNCMRICEIIEEKVLHAK